MRRTKLIFKKPVRLSKNNWKLLTIDAVVCNYLDYNRDFKDLDNYNILNEEIIEKVNYILKLPINHPCAIDMKDHIKNVYNLRVSIDPKWKYEDHKDDMNKVNDIVTDIKFTLSDINEEDTRDPLDIYLQDKYNI